MYCPSCGIEHNVGLKYCKNCGANLNAPAPITDQNLTFGKMMGMLLPVAVVCIGGIIGFGALTAELARSNFDPRALVFLAGIYGATIFGMVALLISLMTRVLGISAPFGQDHRRERHHRGEPEHARLSTPPAAVSSVTEHTTRNFEPIEDSEINRRGPGRRVTQ